MRVWARQYTDEYNYTWVKVETDPSGYNDAVYLSAFAQALQLQPQESPFYAEYGIPSIQAVHSNVTPDMNVYFMQQKYAPNFISLQVIPSHTQGTNGTINPVYNVTAITHTGSVLSAVIPI